MPVSMSGRGPSVRYGTLARRPWESPSFEEVGAAVTKDSANVAVRQRDPSSRGMPAGVPSELYRGPRHQKKIVPPPPPPPPHGSVPLVAQRVRVQSGRPETVLEHAAQENTGVPQMVFDVSRGGWVQPEGARWSNQPTPMGDAVLTRWSPDTGAPNRNVKSNAPRYHAVAVEQGPVQAQTTNAPPGTYDGVASRGVDSTAVRSAGKYARGITVPPWAPPPMGEYTEDVDVHQRDVYRAPKAPGTDVTLRGGSWPTQMTVPS
jgi:hypothetical protein